MSQVKISMEDEATKSNPCVYETEECALKNNQDYQALMSAMTLLHSQRIQAHKDLKKISNEKYKALSDPIAFVNRLQNKEKNLFDIPGKIAVAEVPEVNWEKYIDVVNKAMQNYQVSSSGGNDPVAQSSKPDEKKFIESAKKVPKSSTHNQPWSVEEQRKLDELLIKYPPERFEAQRWVKISQELKNRTPQQIASRVQKYFLKLKSRGLPVPGRQPSSNMLNQKNSVKHQKYKRHQFKTSTFLISYEPPVKIPDTEYF